MRALLHRRCAAMRLLFLLPMLASCSVLPGHGPAAMDIALTEAKTSSLSKGYVLVPLDPTAVNKINGFAPVPEKSEFATILGGTRPMTVGIGDVLLVNIWEASPDGLFSTSESKQVSLEVVADGAGEIFVPYAGRVRAAGRSVEALRQAIQRSLEGKAAEPQVQVLVKENRSNNVVVIGDVTSAGQFDMPAQGLRLLEVIAQAGGTRQPAYETVVTVARGSNRSTIRLDDIVNHPANNIRLAPGDTVFLKHEPRTYSAFGAVESSGLVPLKTETVTLAEAMAQVGGLQDGKADMGGVFLFRFEESGLVNWLTTQGGQGGTFGGASTLRVPVVYSLDFQRPQAFFIARDFRMRDDDIIYVANHPTAELGKFLSTIVQPLVGTARSTAELTD